MDECSGIQVFHGDTDSAITMNDTASGRAAIAREHTCAGDGEILTVDDVARFLRVPKSTVYKLARGGELPASRIGKHWRFLRHEIHEWMRSRSSSVVKQA
jgi:excisionase family DNA binding protein